MSYRPTYYGGFPGPPAESHQNQTRNQGQARGFTPPAYVHPGHDVTYYTDPSNSGFLPPTTDSFYSGNQLLTPDFYHPSNYYPNQHVDYSFDPNFVAGQVGPYFIHFAQQPIDNHSPTNYYVNTANVHPNTSNPDSAARAQSSNDSSSAGKSRRFSRQRNTKDGTSGASGEVFTQPSEIDVNKSRKTQTGQHSIRFSHQREGIKPKEEKRTKHSNRKKEMETQKNDHSKESARQETSSDKATGISIVTKGNFPKSKKNSAKAQPADERNQASVLLDQLSTGTYECMVCCDRIRPHHAVWNCSKCYNLFHMGCIKKWARSPAAKVEESGWRCPGCQNVTKNVPASYYCFCGKVRDPEWIRGEMPHSCGDVCGRARKDNIDCTHPCNILCHPGPCPQCPATVNKKCKCGKTTSRVRCSQQKGFMCNMPCDRLINCQLHKCEEICHSGSCRDCDVTIEQKCFCGKQTREVKCGSEKQKSAKSFEKWEGCYSCEETCEKQLGCENHVCNETCHSGPCEDCPLLPSVVTLCPCTQTKISDLTNDDGSPVTRENCNDPVPTCGKICGKPLACGGEDIHVCKELCHTGNCKPCSDEESTIKCRCGKSEKDVPCEVFVTMDGYKCDRRCNKKRKCGKHKCGRSCCQDTEHTCTQICGHKLTCNSHRCEELCHRGACHTCYNVSFDELRCYCGDQVIFPPIPCGAKPPECANECTRMHSCTHPVRHTCHMDDNCPPCVELVKKPCNCGRIVRGNIMCYLNNVSCGAPCGKVLPCGHKCLKPCHKGDCLDQNSACKQPCSIMRIECIHPCANPCHVGKQCPNTPCKAMITLKCPCGRREEPVECSAGGAIIQSVNSAIYAAKDSVDIGKLIRPGSSSIKTLHCNEECAIVARNKRFAEALNIPNVDYGSEPKQQYSAFLLNAAKNDNAFVRLVEKELINLVESVGWMGLTKQSHSFPSMKREKRQVVHELSEAFLCKSESHDEEPNRNVVVMATKGASKQPSPLLSSVVMETSDKSFPSKPAPKGRLLSSMKLVSYSSSDKSTTDSKHLLAFPRKPAVTTSTMYKPPRATDTSTKKFYDGMSATSSAKEPPPKFTNSSPRSVPTHSAPRPSSNAAPATKPKKSPGPEIDYFDMTE